MTATDETPAQAAPDLTPLGDDATASGITAAAERHEQAAATARGRAGHARAEAEEILSTAKERAAQILAEAEEQAVPLRESAAGADEEAAQLHGIALALGKAAAVMSGAEQEDARVAALRAERTELTSQVAELTSQAKAAQEQLARLAARRRDLESQLAGAGGDDDLAIELSGKISSISTTEAQVTAAEKRATAALAAAGARITAINREDPPYEALFTRAPEVTSRRFRALCLCDEVWPGRPGAALRRPEWYRLNHGLPTGPPQQEPPQPRRTQVLLG
jgi:chromosome segregation ATPase